MESGKKSKDYEEGSEPYTRVFDHGTFYFKKNDPYNPAFHRYVSAREKTTSHR